MYQIYPPFYPQPNRNIKDVVEEMEAWDAFMKKRSEDVKKKDDKKDNMKTMDWFLILCFTIPITNIGYMNILGQVLKSLK